MTAIRGIGKRVGTLLLSALVATAPPCLAVKTDLGDGTCSGRLGRPLPGVGYGFLAEGDDDVGLGHQFPYDEAWDEHDCLAATTAQLKRSRELDYKKMTGEVKQLFEDAILKEWQGWLEKDVAEVISPKDARRVPKHLQIPSRLLLIDKHEVLRTPEQPDLAIAAKARLVILGNLQRGLHKVRTDAPTASDIGSNLVCQHSATWKASIHKADISQAFLSGDYFPDRRLYVVPPRQGLPGVPPGSLLRLKKSAYGLASAPRDWWLKLRREMVSLGWQESRLERAMFMLRDPKTGFLCGLCTAHVDDLLITGTGPFFNRCAAELKGKFKWSSWETDKFEHCGRSVEKLPDGSVKVHQQT